MNHEGVQGHHFHILMKLEIVKFPGTCSALPTAEVTRNAHHSRALLKPYLSLKQGIVQAHIDEHRHAQHLTRAVRTCIVGLASGALSVGFEVLGLRLAQLVALSAGQPSKARTCSLALVSPQQTRTEQVLGKI